MSNCTYIDGVGSSQVIDTAGEIVDLNGLDCSSLTGAAFNFEHKSDLPASICGKILQFKKIFSEKDCETDRHLLFWNKTKAPFLYVMGRLFDDKKDSAKEAAALFIDDAEHPNEPPMLGFSIEGSKIEKVGMIITRSIARKVTLTGCPANKTCIAQMIPSKESSEDDIDDIFKTESSIEIELFKSEIKIPMKKDGLTNDGSPTSPNGILENSEIKKAQVPGSKYPPSSAAIAKPKTPAHPKFESVGNTGKDPGSVIGRTTTGLDIHSHKPVGDYGNISSKEHTEMANKHREMSQLASTGPERSHHNDKYKLHSQAALTSGKKENRFSEAKAEKVKNALQSAKISKSLTVGSGMAAPSTLVGGSALSPESLDKKPKNVGFTGSTGTSKIPKTTNGPRKSGMEKSSKWLARADEEYGKWDKKEEFRKFMSEKLPKLTRGEIDAIGKTLVLGKSLKMEKAISRLNPAYEEETKMHSSVRKKEKQESSKASTIPSSIGSPVLTLSEKMNKFNDGVMDGPMANKEKGSKSLKKQSDVMMASEKRK